MKCSFRSEKFARVRQQIEDGRKRKIPKTKCKKYGGMKCVGESNCDYYKEQQRIIKEQKKTK